MPKAPKWVNDTIESLMASKMPLMTVTKTEYLLPSIKRIRFTGNLSGLHFHLGYAIAFRVSDTEFRNYTASFSDTGKGILEVIIHLHGSAPGSLFMDNLTIGDVVRITFPRGKKVYDKSVKKQWFFGDETSLGLGAAFYSSLQQQQYHFYLELDVANKNVPGLLGWDNYTVLGKKSTFIDEQLIHQLPVFQTPDWHTGNFILTGNAKSVQTIRKVLKQKNVSGKIFAQAYWAEGKTGL